MLVSYSVFTAALLVLVTPCFWRRLFPSMLGVVPSVCAALRFRVERPAMITHDGVPRLSTEHGLLVI